MDKLVWVPAGGDEPGWTVGGTYQVVRLIRFATTVWNTEPLAEQEAIFGRRKADGVPLGQQTEDAVFSYAGDPDGQLIPLDAHIRRANPRTPETERNRILRRGYSYHRNPTDQGLIFVCFQQDLDRGFATIQHRLAGEPLAKYVLPFGGGYYFTPPAHTTTPGDYLGRALIEGG